MNKNLIDLLNTIKFIDVLATIGLFLLIIGVLATQRKKIKDILERWHKKRTFEDTIMECTEANKRDIKRLENELIEFEHTMEDARETSKEIRNVIFDEIHEIAGYVREIKETIDDIREKEKLSKQANIKDKIERIYRESADNKVCTDMQLETLKGLIADYERYGGKNSFVHSVVEKEMYTWEVIKKIS